MKKQQKSRMKVTPVVYKECKQLLEKVGVEKGKPISTERSKGIGGVFGFSGTTVIKIHQTDSYQGYRDHVSRRTRELKAKYPYCYPLKKRVKKSDYLAWLLKNWDKFMSTTHKLAKKDTHGYLGKVVHEYEGYLKFLERSISRIKPVDLHEDALRPGAIHLTMSIAGRTNYKSAYKHYFMYDFSDALASIYRRNRYQTYFCDFQVTNLGVLKAVDGWIEDKPLNHEMKHITKDGNPFTPIINTELTSMDKYIVNGVLAHFKGKRVNLSSHEFDKMCNDAYQIWSDERKDGQEKNVYSSMLVTLEEHGFGPKELVKLLDVKEKVIISWHKADNLPEEKYGKRLKALVNVLNK